MLTIKQVARHLQINRVRRANVWLPVRFTLRRSTFLEI